MQRIDTIFRYFCMACAGIAGILMLSLFVQLLYNSADAWREFDLSFIWSEDWDPYEMKFGALPHIAGTLLSTGMALALAIPPIFQTPFRVKLLSTFARAPKRNKRIFVLRHLREKRHQWRAPTSSWYAFS